MKKIYSLCALISLACSVYAQNWIWAKYFEGANQNKLATHSNGDSYITGTFENCISLGGEKIYSKGLEDVYIMKVDSSGAIQWTRNFGSKGTDQATDIIADENSILITGYISDTLFLSHDTLVTKNGEKTLLVARFDHDGNLSWAKNYPDIKASGKAIAADKEGNIFVIGTYASAAGGGFIARLNSRGDLIWNKKIGIADCCKLRDLATDDFGNAIITGTFTCGKILIDGDSIVYTNGSWGSQLFVVKFNKSGKKLWHNTAAGKVVDDVLVSPDRKGNSYIAGHYYSSTPDFNGTLLKPASSSETYGYLAKLTEDGQWSWAINPGLPGSFYPQDIKTDCNQDLYVIGHDFGKTSGSGTSIRFEKYNREGSRTWTNIIPGKRKYAGSMAFDHDGNVYVSGTTAEGLLKDSVFSDFATFILKAAVNADMSCYQPSMTKPDQVDAFPNPFVNDINIKLSSAAPDTRIMIYNSIGALCFAGGIESSSTPLTYNINLNFLNPGSYILVVKSNTNQVAVRKLIKTSPD